MEYRPPTQSAKPNTLSGAMPNAAVLSAAVDTAANCAAGSVTFCAIHARAVSALVIVSMVVNVFLTPRSPSVVAGSSRSSVSPICAPSTFET